MTKQEIRDKAPSGATHYDDELNFIKLDHVYIWGWINMEWKWLDYRYNIDDYDIEPL